MEGRRIATELIKIAELIMGWHGDDYGQKLHDVEEHRWQEMEQGYSPQHEIQMNRAYERWKRTVEKAFTKEQLHSFGEDQLRHFFDSDWSVHEAIDFIKKKV